MPRSVNSSFIASRALAEESERRGGGRREAELHRTASVGREGAGHERELVERERPHDAGRHQEGDAANDVVEELAVAGVGFYLEGRSACALSEPMSVWAISAPVRPLRR